MSGRSQIGIPPWLERPRRRRTLASTPALLLGLIACAAPFGASAGSQGVSDDLAFDCYAPSPRSHWYEAGDYVRALEELGALADDACPQARRLLAVMAARGQGEPQDLVRAYAYLLLAFAEGVTPLGSADESAPVLGDDPNEFEIVQFGLRLSDRQLAEAEKLATGLISPRAISLTGAVGPGGVQDAIRELEPRRAAYRFKGKLAVLRLPRNGSPLIAGMQRSGSNRILAQQVTDLNAIGVPHELLFIESRMRELGGRARLQDIERDIDLATAKGERFAWLEPGKEVRIVRYGINSSFASQVALRADTSDAASREVYWIDSCFLEVRDASGRLPAPGHSGCL
jgi:hypothetical protein